MTAPPEGVERDFPLARLTTVRTGGPADWFARPASEEELLELLAWAEAEGLAVGVVGSGSNLLVADDGFRGLAIKLDGDLATIERDGEHLLCGGGARLPSAAAKAAGWGLSGLEFGINIPGTAGGAVKMNANAYGGQLARVLEWVDVCTRGRARAPRARAARLRLPQLQPRRRRGRLARLVPRWTPADPAAVKPTLAEMREQAPRGPALRHQDLRLDLQEPRRRARRGAHRGPAAGSRGLPRPESRRRPLLGEARQLRREHRRGDHRRRARADGRGPPPGPRALRRRAGAGGPGAGRGGLARRLGAVKRVLIAAVLVVVVTRGGLRVPAPQRERHAASERSRADLDDRRAGRARSGSSATAPSSPGCRSRANPRCRSCRSRHRPSAAACQGTVLQQALVLGAAPAGAALPCGEQPLRGERGRRRAEGRDRAALRRRLQGGREVAGGGGRARRPVRYRARLCRPARAEPPGDRRGWVTPCRRFPEHGARYLRGLCVRRELDRPNPAW